MRILCTLPNASTEISGIKFEKTPDGMLSVDDVPEEIAEIMLQIPGFSPDAGTAMKNSPPVSAPLPQADAGQKKASPR